MNLQPGIGSITYNQEVFDLNSNSVLICHDFSKDAFCFIPKKKRHDYKFWIPKSVITYKYFSEQTRQHIVRFADWWVNKNYEKL